MACNRCSIDHDKNDCPREISFRLDGTVLYGRCGAQPIEPIDLSPLVDGAETNTTLNLDIPNKQLIFNGETQNSYVNLKDIANLIGLDDLADVDYQVTTDGDILQWDNTKQAWVSYTVPSGTIDTVVGVDANGKLVKQGSPQTPQAPDTVPLGGIIVYPAEVSNLPSSYKECDGQALSRSVYSDLFTLIGTRYGVGDGSTTFNLPNIQGRTVFGLSSSDTQFNVIGQTGGEKSHAMTSNELVTHSHSVDPPSTTTSSAGSHTHTVNRDVAYTDASSRQTYSQGGNQAFGYGDHSLLNSAGAHTHTINIGAFNSANAGGGNPFNVLNPYITMPYVMRVL